MWHDVKLFIKEQDMTETWRGSRYRIEGKQYVARWIVQNSGGGNLDQKAARNLLTGSVIYLLKITAGLYKIMKLTSGIYLLARNNCQFGKV